MTTQKHPEAPSILKCNLCGKLACHHASAQRAQRLGMLQLERQRQQCQQVLGSSSWTTTGSSFQRTLDVIPLQKCLGASMTPREML